MSMIAAFAFALMGSAAPAVQDRPPPPPPAACVGDTFVSWQACADALEETSPYYSLAMINLGSQAYQNGDRAAALRFYDKAERADAPLTGDVFFHTFRADVRSYAGREAEALADALIAWGYVEGQAPQGVSPADVIPLTDQGRGMVLATILPILRQGDRAAFARAKAMYASLPASSWQELSMRAVVLAEIGDRAAAVSASERALAMAPEEPGLMNNHCYVMVLVGRPADGLPYCQRAVAALPDVAPIRHSLAAALAAVGRCTEAEAELAQARRLEPVSALYREPLACTPAA